MEDRMILEWKDGTKVIRPMTQEEIDSLEVVPSHKEVNQERDRRLDLSFSFEGKMIQRDPVSLRRIQGAAQMATIWIISGQDANSQVWVNSGPLEWITDDNTTLNLTPAQTIAMGQEAARVETKLVFAAKRLKEMDPIPSDYMADHYWEDSL